MTRGVVPESLQEHAGPCITTDPLLVLVYLWVEHELNAINF
ncbi:hypothetical protein RchiOBHm_Chr4g0392591 [Rosa chinensis]|uniref:Uncharacterized protein n=1 Tax=Rosa chinensis TaxID=74649 RepID=A0A2P6QQS3_ROSCH|nr:hypothetical protein RchiOBHm_Chr4g0392591 [Rosa chinensis]